MPNVEPILAEIKKLIMVREPEAEIILFGSYARGESNPDSDLDILILLEKENISHSDEKNLSHPLYDLELKSNLVISALIRSKNKWYEKYPNTALFKNIKKDGIRI